MVSTRKKNRGKQRKSVPFIDTDSDYDQEGASALPSKLLGATPKRKNGYETASPPQTPPPSDGLLNDIVNCEPTPLQKLINILSHYESIVFKFSSFDPSEPMAALQLAKLENEYQMIINEGSSQIYNHIYQLESEGDFNKWSHRCTEILNKIQEAHKKYISPHFNRATYPDHSIQQDHSHELASELKLHALLTPTVPIYFGDITQFPEFIAAYNEAVHDRKIPIQNKMAALRSKLMGAPHQLIANLGSSNLDYDNCYNALIKKYTNLFLTVSTLHDRVQKIGQLDRVDLQSLEKLVSETSTLFTAVDHLSLVDPLDFSRFHYTFSKLTQELRDEFHEKVISLQENLPTFDQLLQFLNNKIEIFRVRSAEVLMSPRTVNRFETNKPQKINNRKSTNQVINPPSSNVGGVKSSEMRCYFCDQSHFLYHCDGFQNLTRPNKISFVRDHSLCSNCFSHKHQTDECRSDRVCRYCSKKHHWLLHDSTSPQLAVDQKRGHKQHRSPIQSRSPSPYGRSYSPSTSSNNRQVSTITQSSTAEEQASRLSSDPPLTDPWRSCKENPTRLSPNPKPSPSFKYGQERNS